MDSESTVSQLVNQLVSLVSSNCTDHKEVIEAPSSCFDFEDDTSNGPVELNLKRRCFETSRRADQIEPINVAENQNEKKLKTCSNQKVGYVFSPELIKQVSRLPKVKGRAHQVHELIASYKLLSHLIIVPARNATEDELSSFHSREYIDYIKSCDGNNTCENGSSKNETVGQMHPRSSHFIFNPTIQHTVSSELEERNKVKIQGSQEGDYDVSILDTSQRGEEDFGLGYDCPLLFDIFNLIKLIAGSTLSAVESIISGKVDIAINWAGGWHHATKYSASGFCYVNDIVVGILKFLEHGYNKILYVDFDLHHGDGVESAFGHTDKVFTLSFHKYDVGFFPGTGSLHDIGSKGSKGIGYTMNVPLKDGITDENYAFITTAVVSKVIEKIQPQVIIAQFGADGLTCDPMNSFNLTPKSLVACLQFLKETAIPLVVLGGGGYNIPNVARCWTLLTACAVGISVANDIPDSDRFFLTYGPSYELSIDPGFRKDENSPAEIKVLLQTVMSNLRLVDRTL